MAVFRKENKVKKFKIEVTLTVEYEIDPKLYPKGYTPEECLAMDLRSFEDDPCMITMYNDIKVKGRIVDIHV